MTPDQLLAYGLALLTLVPVLLIAAVVVHLLERRSVRPERDTNGPGIELVDGSVEIR